MLFRSASVHLHARQRGAHTVRISQCGLVFQIQMLNAVRGQDVHAWVEALGSDGRWAVVPTATFMPDRNKTPEQQPRATAKDSNAADVPPPNAQRPPGSVDATFQTTSASVRPPTLLERLGALPGWVLLLLRVIGYPLLALLAMPLAMAIPRQATAPALILIGIAMLGTIRTAARSSRRRCTGHCIRCWALI